MSPAVAVSSEDSLARAVQQRDEHPDVVVLEGDRCAQHSPLDDQGFVHDSTPFSRREATWKEEECSTATGVSDVG